MATDDWDYTLVQQLSRDTRMQAQLIAVGLESLSPSLPLLSCSSSPLSLLLASLAPTRLSV